jgi:tRNA 5-methylaminomethyl-2-thiouridine biosynthesis bifunctional protein
MKIENAKISWLESGLPYSTQFQDIYYSRDDAVAESQHVFLEANKLRQRWEQDSSIEVFHIGELGFGSGLNFLQVMKLWQGLDKRPERLHYIAFEKHPLTIEELQRIHQRWTSLVAQSAELLEQYTDHSEGCHRIPLTNGIILDVYYGDAFGQLKQRMTHACPAIQCWFLDGFSPANNIELWEEPLMHLLASCSDEGTTLSTYSVAGKVRSALKNAGFEVKVSGESVTVSTQSCLQVKLNP